MSPFVYTVTFTPGQGYVMTLDRGDDKTPIQVGTRYFKADAEQACRDHFARACDLLTKLGKPLPEALFM